MTRTSKLAYLSGLVDTDGFIGLDDGMIHELRFCVRTGVTSRKVCKHLQQHFGGDFYRVPRADGTKVYYWKLYGSVAMEELLHALLPFLKARRGDAVEALTQLKATREPSDHVLNRREIAAYRAGIIDAEGFIESAELGKPDDLEKFFLSVLPYLVERKSQVNAMLASFRTLHRNDHNAGHTPLGV